MLTRFAIGRPERKFIDTYVNTASILQAAAGITPTLLTGVAQGTDNNQRIGRKIMLTNIQYRQILNGLSAGETGAIDTDMVRILMVRDMQFTGLNTPTLQDVLEDTGTATGTFFIAYNDLRTQGNQRFRTMLDKIVPISTGTGQNYQLRLIKYFKKTRLTLDFNGGAAVASSAGRNAIWLFVFKLNTTTVAVVNTEIAIRVRFTDV